MEVIKALVRGVIEFRSDLTMHYDDPRLEIAYDHGRDLAHKITLRRFDHE